MKKGILILICFCCFGGLSHAQNKQIDSLLQVLRTSKEDTGKVNTLNTLAHEFINNNHDTVVYFANEALTLATRLNFKLGIADAHTIIGIGLTNLGKIKDAMKNLNEALKLYDELLPSAKTVFKSRILKGKSRAYNNIGNIYYNQGNYSEALKVYSASLKISEEIGDKKSIAGTNGNIGIIYEHQGNYPVALKNYFTTLKIFEETGNKQGIARTYTNIGNAYMHQGHYPEALKNYFASLKFKSEIGDKQGIATSYNNIGVIYDHQDNYPEALKNYFTSLKIRKEIGDKKGIASSYSNIGNIYHKQGNIPEALKNYFASLKIREEIGDKQGIANSYSNIGNICDEQGNYPEAVKNQLASIKIAEEIGDKETMTYSFNSIGEDYIKLKKNSEAFRYLNKGLSLAKEIGSLDDIRESYLGLSALDSAKGNFKQSLEHYKMYIIYRDSLVNKEATKKTMQIQMQYEFDKKESLAKAEQEKKDALSLKELQKQKLLKNFFIGGIGLVLVLFFFIYRTYRARQALRLYDIRNRIAGDLHDDIGSTLNSISIYSEVAKKKDEHHDEALEMIGDASRKVIDAMSDIVWTINAENDSFAKIIFRMKSLAYNLFRAKKIEFTFHADEILNEKKLSLEERRNFYLIFKEAVNNLVKYSEATRVAITLTNENNWIKLRIQDNGVGFDTSQDNTGNGLKNMKRRAGEMNAGFQIDSQIGKGTTIQLILNS